MHGNILNSFGFNLVTVPSELCSRVLCIISSLSFWQSAYLLKRPTVVCGWSHEVMLVPLLVPLLPSWRWWR